MSPNPNNPALMHHEDAREMSDSRKAVSDDDAGATLKSGAHRILYYGFAPIVETRGCLIEDEHRRSLCKSSHDADELNLPSGEMSSELAHGHIEHLAAESRVESIEPDKLRELVKLTVF